MRRGKAVGVAPAGHAVLVLLWSETCCNPLRGHSMPGEKIAGIDACCQTEGGATWERR